MKVLITGGAGFIGRWIVKKMLEKKEEIYIIDDLSGGDKKNLCEFRNEKNIKEFIKKSITDEEIIKKIFKNDIKLCFHLAAKINVSHSLTNPYEFFETNIRGTFNLLEEAKKKKTKIVFTSTCMVYDQSTDKIKETHLVKPTSPYAASKLAAENIILSYHYAYNLPAVILRPFNVYGPFQKTDAEGGVIGIFINNILNRQKLHVYGDGNQTRDFLYVEDCADFIIKAGYGDLVNGEILNAGTGKEISIKTLAKLISKDKNQIKYLSHPHPKSEIYKLCCNYQKAKKILNWFPTIDLEKGIEKTKKWIKEMKFYSE